MTESHERGRLPDCVLERKRRLDTGEPLEFTEVWHVARSRGRTSEFAPIRCSKDEGILLPGPTERRTPTCPECAALLARTEVDHG